MWRFLKTETVMKEPGTVDDVGRSAAFADSFGLPEDPAFSIGGRSLSNANIFVLDQFMTVTKADFKISTCALLNLVLH